ncbi:MAG: peptide-methionine (S)-S-oxide reductase MsrA [Pseudomonadales bacterium]
MSFLGLRDKSAMPAPETALPGRALRMDVSSSHFVLGTSLEGPFPEVVELAYFGLGCFWGAERKFWALEGVYTTAVGYAAGFTPNPTYQEVCSGQTGHNEVVMVAYNSEKCNYRDLLKVFWEVHNPTQGMRQGNDKGTQYRSGIYFTSEAQRREAVQSRDVFQQELNNRGFDEITTEILEAPEFYYAEEYHQQYLAKNPAGYCGLGGTGACLPPN